MAPKPCAGPGARTETDASRCDSGALEQQLAAVIPYFHPHDEARADRVSIHVAVALEGRPVRPLAMQRPGVVDDGALHGAPGHDVCVLEALLHPAVALRVEGGAFGRLAHRARAREDDLDARGQEAARARGIG